MKRFEEVGSFLVHQIQFGMGGGLRGGGNGGEFIKKIKDSTVWKMR